MDQTGVPVNGIVVQAPNVLAKVPSAGIAISMVFLSKNLLHDHCQRRGQCATVVVSPEHYERMLEVLEEAEDVAAFDEAMTEEGPSIPWAQVKADLGWA